MHDDARKEVERWVEVIRWLDGERAVVRCPGDHHEADGSPPMIFMGSSPYVHCFHDSCASWCASTNRELASLFGENPELEREPTPEEKRAAEFKKRCYRLKETARHQLLPTLKPVDPVGWLDSSPVNVQVPVHEQFALFMGLFPGDDIIWTGERNESGEASVCAFRMARQWIERGRPYGQLVSVFNFKPDVLSNGLRQAKYTHLRRFLILESDDLDLPQFGGVITWMKQFSRLRALVLTGGKLDKPITSVHAYFEPPSWPYPWEPLEFQSFDWAGKHIDIHELAENGRYYRDDPAFARREKSAWRSGKIARIEWQWKLTAWRHKYVELLSILEGLACDGKMLRSNLTARCPGVERRDEHGRPTGRWQELIYLDL